MNREPWSGVVLEGDRVLLRAMGEEDAEAVVGWRNDPRIRRWLFSREQPTLASHLAWFRRRKPGRIDFVICLKETGRPIGTVTFERTGDRCAEAGKMIGDPSLWGRGLMVEAYRIWLAFGFERLGLSHIRVRTKASNKRSVRVNERVGFTVEEVLPGGDDGEGVLVMALSREGAVRKGLIPGDAAAGEGGKQR